MKDKPEGRWECLACEREWDGSELYLDPQWILDTWTCGNLYCGGVCTPVLGQPEINPDVIILVATPNGEIERKAHSF